MATALPTKLLNIPFKIPTGAVLARPLPSASPTFARLGCGAAAEEGEQPAAEGCEHPPSGADAGHGASKSVNVIGAHSRFLG